jgi:DNA-binding NarL/FixJ family response regulator
VDDHVLARSGLKAILNEEPGLVVVGEAADGLEAVEACRRACPDLILMDVRMPQMDGLAATREIKRECPSTSVLIVTMHEDPNYLYEALKAGAAGYVLKGADREELTGAVRSTLGGESSLDSNIAADLLRRFIAQEKRPVEPPREGARAGWTPEPLTRRENQVLVLLVGGKTNQEIARDLTISVSTVKTHVQKIIAKLGVSDRTQAAVKAIETGLFVPEWR